MTDVDLGTAEAPQSEDDVLLGKLIERLVAAREAAEGNRPLQLVVEGLAVGFLMDDSPQAKGVVRALLGSDG